MRVLNKAALAAIHAKDNGAAMPPPMPPGQAPGGLLGMLAQAAPGGAPGAMPAGMAPAGVPGSMPPGGMPPPHMPPGQLPSMMPGAQPAPPPPGGLLGMLASLHSMQGGKPQQQTQAVPNGQMKPQPKVLPKDGSGNSVLPDNLEPSFQAWAKNNQVQDNGKYDLRGLYWGLVNNHPQAMSADPQNLPDAYRK